MLQASESDKQLIGVKAREAEAQIIQLQQAATTAAAAHDAALTDKQAALDTAVQQVAGLREEAQHTAELLRVAEESKGTRDGLHVVDMSHVVADIITAELEATLSKVAMLERDLATEQQALAGRNSELKCARSDIASLEQQRDTLQHDLTALQDHAAHVEASLADAQANGQSLAAELADVSESLRGTQVALTERDTQLADARQGLAATHEQVAKQEVALAQRAQDLEATAQHVATLQALLVERDADISSLRGALEEERANLQGVLASLQGVQAELERSMQQAAAEQQALQDELAEVRGGLQALQAKHQVGVVTIVQCNRMLIAIASLVVSLQESMEHAEQQRGELSGRVDTLTGEMGSLTASVATLTAQLEEATAQCFSLKVELNNERAAKGAEQRAHDETKAFFSASLAAKEAQVAASQERDEALRQDLRRQLEVVGGAGGADLGARELVKAVAEATAARMGGLNREAEGLRGWLQEARALAMELEGVVRAKEAAAEEDARQMQELGAALSDVQAVLVATRAQLAAQLEEAQGEQQQLAVQLQEVQAQLADAQAARVQLTAQLEEAQAGSTQLSAQLADAEADNDHLTAQLEEAQAAQTALSTRLQITEADKVQLTAQLADAEAAHTALSTQLLDAQAATTALSTQLQESEAGKLQLQTDLEALTQQLLHRDAALKEVTAETAEAKQETAALLEAVAALEQQLVSAKAEATDAQEAAAMATADLQAVQTEAAALGTAHAAQRTRVGELEGQLARLNEANVADREAYQQVARAHDALREEVGALQEGMLRNGELLKQQEAATMTACKQATDAQVSLGHLVHALLTAILVQAELQQLHKRLAATPKGKDAAARVAVLEQELRAALQEGDRVRGLAQQAETALLENRRLGEDNVLLASRVTQVQWQSWVYQLRVDVFYYCGCNPSLCCYTPPRSCKWTCRSSQTRAPSGTTTPSRRSSTTCASSKSWRSCATSAQCCCGSDYTWNNASGTPILLLGMHSCRIIFPSYVSFTTNLCRNIVEIVPITATCRPVPTCLATPWQQKWPRCRPPSPQAPSPSLPCLSRPWAAAAPPLQAGAVWPMRSSRALPTDPKRSCKPPLPRQ